MSKRNVWTYKSPKSKKRKLTKSSVEAVKVLGVYSVEEILDHAYHTDGRLMFYLKWEGYDESDNSWEFEQQLVDCTDARNRFSETFNGRHPPKFSWEEFDNLCKYLKKVVKPSFGDTAVLQKLANKSVTIFDIKDKKRLSEIKYQIETQTKELNDFNTLTGKKRSHNSQRLKATQLAKTVSKNLNIDENFGSIREFVEFVDKRAKIEPKLKSWVNKANAIIEKSGEGVPISVANEFDDEVPTLDHYICESILDKQKFKTKNKTVSEEFTVYSCECNNCYDERQECCSPVIGFPMTYNRKGVLSNSSLNTNIIFECNVNCECGTDCPNRVVQRGRQYKLELFRTEDASRGWGVRPLVSMPKGAYVSTYVGEVISLTEANKRPTTFLFDLSASWDQMDNEYTYVIDADKYGNIVRYVNHSCEPNCRAILVWSDSYDKLLPKVCLFTIRPIRANEELTYDYGMQIISITDQDDWEQTETISTDSGNVSNETDSQISGTTNSLSPQPLIKEKVSKVSFKKIECRCGSKQCRKYLYS